eukprot:scaffold7804_cov390-Prasinococcus_capsulatus_cf.AAC.5
MAAGRGRREGAYDWRGRWCRRQPRRMGHGCAYKGSGGGATVAGEARRLGWLAGPLLVALAHGWALQWATFLLRRMPAG